ncbi:hypothetical protein Pelo_7576 [Pelomyxa schiedti]|nr:hypothetical protein Pelo_7576 [Pelomyxa schiedti]
MDDVSVRVHEAEESEDTGGTSADILCFVVGPDLLVNRLLESVARTGSFMLLPKSDPPIMAVMRTQPSPSPTATGVADVNNPAMSSSSCSYTSPSKTSMTTAAPSRHKTGERDADDLTSLVPLCNEVSLWDPTNIQKNRYVFKRCNRGDKLTRVASDVHLEPNPKAIIVLHTVEDRNSFKLMPNTLEDLLDSSSADRMSDSKCPPVNAGVLVVDCRESPGDTADTDTNIVVHSLQAIELAFAFCAFKMLKWAPKPDTLGVLLSLVSEASHQLATVCSVTRDLYFSDFTVGTPPPLHTPCVLDIAQANATAAHVIMQLVHNHRPQLPFFSVTMALRTWVTTKNWDAVGVVCLARSLTQSEDINLSYLELESVHGTLRTLSCRTLDLSGNNITSIPKWLAEMPNVIFGNTHWAPFRQEQEDVFLQSRNYVTTNTHKLVFVGDTAVGKTILLRCMMENKKKLTTKHIHTGLSVYHKVRFRSKTIRWTVWDLGGDSLSPFHPWFLLSKSILILVFDVRKSLEVEEPRKPSVYRWMNEITVSRSRGDKTRRVIVPVGTHMEGIDAKDLKVYSLLEPIVTHQEVPFALLMQLSDGSGWTCEDRHIKECGGRGVSLLIAHLEGATCGDGIPNSVPQQWLALHKELRKMRKKRRVSTLRWSKFVKLSIQCGLAGRTREIEECAHFLVSIGTIIHFRYPFWLLSPNHPGAAPSPGLSDLVILEPGSFLLQLIEDTSFSGKKSTSRLLSSATRAALPAILDEFCGLYTLRSKSANLFEGEYLSLFPLSHTQLSCTALTDSFQASSAKGTITSSSATITGRSIKFPQFPLQVFFKAISMALMSLLSDENGWVTKFCWSDTIWLSHSCPHEGKLLEKVFLFITCRDDTVSICMRSEECKMHWNLPLQQSFWAGLVGILHHFSHLMVSHFEEESDPSQWVGNYIELFPCPHCLLEGTAEKDWSEPRQPFSFPAHFFYFVESDIFDAMKNTENQLTCGLGTCPVDVAMVAPDLLLKNPKSISRGSDTADLLVIPSELKEVFGNETTKCVTLGELLSLLIGKA